jgi:DNA invertase Pin-like site-specific DNA recombinase
MHRLRSTSRARRARRNHQTSQQLLRPDRQRLTRRTALETVFIDKASGKLARRPELDRALLVARADDQLVVTKLDRLGRSLELVGEAQA